MDESGNTKDDLTLPKGTDELDKLAEQIRSEFDAGKDVSVTVLKVRGGDVCCMRGWTAGAVASMYPACCQLYQMSVHQHCTGHE